MKVRRGWTGSTILFVLAAVALWSSSLVVGSPNQQASSTEQQQTIDAIVQQRFQQTAQAQQLTGATQTIDAAFNLALTSTAAFQATLDAGFNRALTATAAPLLTEIAATQQSQDATATYAEQQSLYATAAFNTIATATGAAIEYVTATHMRILNATATASVSSLLSSIQSQGRFIFVSPTGRDRNGNITSTFFDMKPDGTSMQRLAVPGAGSLYISEPVLSPDGATIAFAWQTDDLTPSHYISAGPLGGFADKIGDCEGAWCHNPAWAPDFTHIVYAVSPSFHGQKPTGLYVVDVTNNAEQLLLSGQQIFATDPTWSPDGQIIAFTGAIKDSNSTHIYVISSNGSTPHYLIDAGNLYDESFPAWAPDGNHLAFAAYISDEQTQAICVVDVNASHISSNVRCPIKFGPDHSATKPVWSPDSQYIGYVCEKNAICVEDTQTSNLLQINTSLEAIYDLAWSTCFGVPCDAVYTDNTVITPTPLPLIQTSATRVLPQPTTVSPTLISPSVQSTDMREGHGETIISPTEVLLNDQSPSLDTLSMLREMPTATIVQSPIFTATVTTNHLNVRRGPGPEYDQVMEISTGTQITVIGRNADATWI